MVSNKLYIANSGTSTSLIYGDFCANLLTINNNLSVNGLAGTGTRVVATDAYGKLQAAPANTTTFNYYGTIDVDDALSLTNASGIIASASQNYSSGADAAITITLSSPLSNYIPVVMVESINTDTTTSSTDQ